ncbi:MAG TPA: alkylmercury lyase family protein [Actinomycetes bacterium]|jgi:alkylmercury lyase|nr:alkylmercury lyase family protein [Actinomycetes bacterium]
MTSNPPPQPAATDALDDRLGRLGLPAGTLQERQAGLPGPLREFHRRVLGGFLAHAGPPPGPAVASMAAGLGLDPREALRALAAADLVHTDPTTGQIVVAYPFSGRPTSHRVELAGGPVVAAMCALDALGIPQMTGSDARISSTDPSGGQPVTVALQGEVWQWRRAAMVVLVATAAGGVCAAVADGCCPHINLHPGPQQARAYLQAHQGMTGEVLGQAEAVEVAGRIFGGLLDPQRRQAMNGTDTRR